MNANNRLSTADFANRFFLTLAALLAILMSLTAAAQGIGRIEFVAGDARITRGAQVFQAVRAAEVLQGDVIVTGINGQIQLRMIDNAFVALRANSRFTLEQYQVKGDANDSAVLSLAYGILRTFTGALVGRDKSKFIMKAQNATIGIRGSGNILSYNDTDGTVNHTLTGAHSVTSRDLQGIERTLISKPGQTVQVAPGGSPKFIPTPAYIFAAASSPVATSAAKEGDAPATEPAAAPAASATAAVEKAAAPAATTTASATTTQAAAQAVINSLAARQFSANEDLGVIIRTSVPFGSAQRLGFAASGGQGPRGSDATFDSAGNLVKMNNINASEFITGPGGAVPNLAPVNLVTGNVAFSGGVAADSFRNADNSIVLGRWQGGQMSVTDTATANAVPTVYQLGSASASYAIYRELPLGILYSLTGATSYKVDAATRPTDSFGNIGQLVSAFLNVNFSSRLADMGIVVAINNQNLTLGGTAISFDGGFTNFGLANRIATCTGSNCNSGGYRGTLNGFFAGSNGTAAGASYRINPNRLTGQAFADMIVGNIAFTALSAPTSISLPLTGSIALSMNNFVDNTANQTPNQFPVVATGTISANFSNRTLGFNMVFTDTDPSTNHNVHTATASGVPIIGVGFSASSNGTPLKNDGRVTITCTGNCNNPAAGIVSRFDGYFTNALGNGAIVNIVAADAGEVAGVNGVNGHGLIATAYFGTALAPIAGPTASTPTSATVLNPLGNVVGMSRLMLSERRCARCYSP